ncbi:MAG TPA: Ig-like domain-containing protein [Longimicrobiaceae bacterium]
MSRKKPLCAAGMLAVLALFAGCRDNPTDPATSEMRLELRRGDVPFQEETIAPGGTLQLNAKLITATGSEQDASGATWSTSDIAVATVDTKGKVTAVGVGSTRVIVRLGERADTGVINVAQPVTGALECGDGVVDVSLAPGETQVFVGEEAVNLCLPGSGPQGTEYLLVAFNASTSAGARLNTRVAGSLSTLPSTDLAPARVIVPAPKLREGPVQDERFHEWHLERSRAEFASALRFSVSPPPVTARALPAVGSLMRLNAATFSGGACSNPDYRTGRVVAVSDRAIIVADTTNPANGFTTSDYETIAATFDDLIWRVNTSNFGEPTDIDNNDRVIIFYTRAVNELTPAGADSYVGGFFYNRDLFPKSGSNACAGSNEAEMFYMLVPDPNGEVNGNVRGKNFVLERTFSVLAHEFQHLINDSRRLYVNKALVWEEGWLNEGLSHIAEELAFYAASGYEPRNNLGSGPVSSPHFSRYNVDNVARYINYLREPEKHSLMGEVDELATRGAVWAFLRYVADREPGDDQAMWMRLVNSKTVGLENLEEVLGVDPLQWMEDWQVSVFTDDADIDVDERYTQPSWNFRLLTQFLDTSGRFPLRTLTVRPDAEPIPLDGGAAAFLRARVESGSERAVRTTVEGLPPPSRLRLAVVRID